MFDSIRKHQRLLQFVLLLLILPAFAFFGISGYDRFFSDSDAIATVDGAPITRAMFDEAQRQQIEQLRASLGSSFDPAMLQTASAQKEILQGLIVQRALAWAAQNKRIAVTDAELRDIIMAIPGLQDKDGKFDRERYTALLAARGMTEAGFEAEQRRELALRALPESIGRTASVPPMFAEKLLRANEQTRVVRVKRFSAEDYVAQTGVKPQEYRAYFDANPREFEIPESASVAYVTLSAKDIAAKIELDPAEVRQYYDQNPNRFGKPEARRASHILVAVSPQDGDASTVAQAKEQARAKADALLARIRAGADFADLARESSDDSVSKASGGDLDFFERDGIVPAIADAAFGIKQVGEVAGPVESEYGWHLVKLTAVRAAQTKSFDSVRAEIEQSLRESKARARFGESAEAFSNLVYEQADTLEPAAKKFGLAVQKIDNLGRAGSPTLGAQAPLNNSRVLRALFSADSISRHQNTEAIDIGENQLVSARIIEHHPARVPDFASVEAEVAAKVKARDAARLAREAGEAELAALREGKHPPEGFGNPQTSSRAGAPSMPGDALKAVFEAPSGKLPAFVGAALGPNGYAIYQITEVKDPSEADVKARLDAYRKQLAEIYGQAYLDAYFSVLREQAKVIVHDERLGAAVTPATN